MQENNSIATYYTKMKRVWNELQSIEPIPQCTCGALMSSNCN